MSSTPTSTVTLTSRPTSLSDSGVHFSSPDVEKQCEPLTSLASQLNAGDDGRAKLRMEKYFAEKTDKNIFMKLIHPSYHERNLQFKKIFVDKGLIDENDQFLASYSCAYQREILAQGRMFISQFNVCFYANIIGWETTLVIPMKEIKMVKKMKAAFIFPNSIQIERDSSEKYFFASFINRDKSFQVLTTAHQKVIAGEGVKAMTREEVWDMVYNNETSQNPTPLEGSTSASVTNASTENMTNLSSHSFNGSISPHTASSPIKSAEKDNTSQSSTSSDFHDDDFATHFSEQYEQEDDGIEEVPCPCTEHVGRLIMDKEFKVSIEKFYELLFTENEFLTKLHEKSKVADYVSATWVRDHQGENTRTCTYSVSLNHAMASKKIIVNERQVLTHFPNPKQGFVMQKETQNSGVPYSDHFTVNCRCCFSRTGPNSCRLKVHGGIVYKKHPWAVVKTFIEKGTHQGLDEHYQLLSKMVDEYTSKEEGLSASHTYPAEKEDSKGLDGAIKRLRKRCSRSAERLLAGEELDTNSAHEDFVSEIIGHNVKVCERTITVNNKAEYTPFLLVIIVLLALFFVVNLMILREFQEESASAIRHQRDHDEMLLTLIEQVKKLKIHVDEMQGTN